MTRDVTKRLDEDDRSRDDPDVTPGPKVDPQHGGPDEAETGVVAEARLFGRMAAFGIVVGIAYWFLTYETAGSVMLTTFGIASGIAALAIFLGSRGRRGRTPPAADGPIGATHAGVEEPVPRPGWAPIGLAIGLGGVALAGPFGPWLAIAGLVLALRSAKVWLDQAMRETDEARGLRRPEDDLGA